MAPPAVRRPHLTSPSATPRPDFLGRTCILHTVSLQSLHGDIPVFTTGKESEVYATMRDAVRKFRDGEPESLEAFQDLCRGADAKVLDAEKWPSSSVVHWMHVAYDAALEQVSELAPIWIRKEIRFDKPTDDIVTEKMREWGTSYNAAVRRMVLEAGS